MTASVHPTFTYGDSPERWIQSDGNILRARTDAYRNRLWQQFESQVSDGGWAFGEQFSALDVYIAVMTQWRPRRTWFAQYCPLLHRIAMRAETHPLLSVVLQRNFPPSL